MRQLSQQSKEREIEVWQRYKTAYERHQAGKTYAEIARDLGISTARASELADNWKQMQQFHDHYLAHRQEYTQPLPNPYHEKRRREGVAQLERLEAAGLLGDGKRSPEYGYA